MLKGFFFSFLGRHYMNSFSIHKLMISVIFTSSLFACESPQAPKEITKTVFTQNPKPMELFYPWPGSACVYHQVPDTQEFYSSEGHRLALCFTIESQCYHHRHE